MPSLVLPPDAPGADPLAAVAPLRRAYAQLLLRTFSSPSAAPTPPLRAPWTSVVTRLGQLARTRPAAATEILVEPSVAVAMHCGRAGQALALIAAELAWRRLLPDPIELRFDEPWSVWSVARNVKIDYPAGAAVTWSDASPPEPGPAHPFPPVGEAHALALFDGNPLAQLEDHPEKSGNAISLGDRPIAEWIAALEGALALIARYLPGLRAEMVSLHRQFHPVGFDAQRHLSASYREYVGAMYLTLHPDPITMATAVIHEFGHSKLNLVTFLDPLLRNERSFRVRSPVRPDPRPLMGVLLAAHAFVPVAELYRRILHTPPDPDRADADRSDVERRLVDTIARNAEALDVIDAHADPTPLGAELIADLHRLHDEHACLPLTARRPTAVAHD